MDGVIYHGNRLLPGVKEFVEWLYKEDKKFLFLTNSSDRSPRDLQQKLQRMGLDIDETHFTPAHRLRHVFKQPVARMQRLRYGRSRFDERFVRSWHYHE